MDPIQQILAQGQMGDKNGGLQQYYFEGKRLAQQDQQINLQKQHLLLQQQQQAKEDALLPYKQEAMRLSNRNEALAIDSNVMKLKVLTQQNEALPEVLQLQSDFLASPQGYKDSNLIVKGRMLSQKYPFAFIPGTPGGDIFNSSKADVMAQHQWNMIEDAQQKISQSTNPNRYVSHLGPAGISIGEKTPSVSSQPGTMSTIGKQTMDSLAARGITRDSPDFAAEYQKTFEENQTRQDTKDNLSVKTNPDGSMEFVKGMPGKSTDGPTTAQANKAEDAATAAVNASTAALDVIKYAETGNVGLLGNINRLKSSFGGQFADIKPGSEFKYAQATDFLKSAAVKVLRSDGNISEAERRQVIDNLPKTSVNESPATAREKAINVARTMAESARRQIMRAGRPLPPELMTEAEIKTHFDNKDITLEQAKELLGKAPLSSFYGGPFQGETK